VDGSFEVSPIVLPEDRLTVLQSHLMLSSRVFPRTALKSPGSRSRNMGKREKELRLMQEMVDQVGLGASGQYRPDRGVWQLLHQGWMYKTPAIRQGCRPPIFDTIYESARSAGASAESFWRGRGGFFLLFVRPEHQKTVREKLSHLIRVPFPFRKLRQSGCTLPTERPFWR